MSVNQCSEHCAVQSVQAHLVDVEHQQSCAGRAQINDATGVDIREVTDPSQKSVGDSRGPPRTRRDFRCRIR